MKLHKLFLMLILSLCSLISYANAQIDTVATAKSKKQNDPVMLTGTIAEAIDKTDFILKDSTGSMLINIKLSEAEKLSFFTKNPYLVGATVVIEGTFSKKRITDEIIVTKIQVTNPAPVDPFMMVLNDNFSYVQTVKSAISLKDKSPVLLYGIVVQVNEQDSTVSLRDQNGNDITIELDFYTRSQKIDFMNKYSKTLVNSTVVVQGFLDKESVEKAKVKGNRIQMITRSSNDPFADTVNKAKSANSR